MALFHVIFVAFTDDIQLENNLECAKRLITSRLIISLALFSSALLRKIIMRVDSRKNEKVHAGLINLARDLCQF